MKRVIRCGIQFDKYRHTALDIADFFNEYDPYGYKDELTNFDNDEDELIEKIAFDLTYPGIKREIIDWIDTYVNDAAMEFKNGNPSDYYPELINRGSNLIDQIKSI